MMLTFSFVAVMALLPFSTFQLHFNTCVTQSSPTKDSLLDILRNLESFQICVWSNNFNDETTLNILNNLSSYKSLVIFKFSSVLNLPKTCMANIMIVHYFTDQETCEVHFSNHGLGLNVHHTFIVLIVSDCRFCAEKWFLCSGMFRSARVAIVSLADSRVFLLSSPVFPPRMFIQSDLSDLLKPLDIAPPTLAGREVPVATFNCSPFIIFRENNSLDRVDGIDGGVLRELKNKLNFSMRLVPLMGDGRWGSVINNSWTGGIGKAVAEGAAELGVCNIWNALNYYRIADFGPPTNVVTFTFIVPRPRLIENIWHGLITALSGPVWICTVAAGLTTVLCYSLHSYVHHQSMTITDHLLEGMMVVWGKLTLTSWWARTARQLIGWWCVFVLLLSAVYSSSIVAQLTRPRYEPRLDTLRQLLDGDYHWIDENNSSSWRYIYFNLNVRAVLESVKNEWQEKWEQRNEEVKPEELADAVRSRRIALPTQRWDRNLVFLTIPGLDYERDLNDMRVMKETTSEIHVGFVIAKWSPLQTIFQMTLQRFSETGLFSFWASNTVLKHEEKYSKMLLQERDDHVETSAKQLTMNNLGPAFIILAGGLIASTLVFLAEILWHRHSTKTSPYPFILCLL